jgi:hypothetical protein
LLLVAGDEHREFIACEFCIKHGAKDRKPT